MPLHNVRNRQQIKIYNVFSFAVIAASLSCYIFMFCCLGNVQLFFFFTVWEIIGLVPEVASDNGFMGRGQTSSTLENVASWSIT